MNICVFCSSSDELDSAYYEKAAVFGDYLGRNNINLVFGAGGSGLMGVVSETMRRYPVRVVGIIPEKLNKEHIVSKNMTDLFVTSTMSERKNMMIEKSDGFVALPGGFGTLEEILEVITLKQLNYFDKPIAFWNFNNFFDPLFAMFDKLFAENFAKDENGALYFISDNVDEVINYILNYQNGR
ncbi:MAG TPA: TIGR00730 family Rossman fold protein [Spirochaetota bacterium]|jgi:hypothetical protein|nr:MAG: LOG family protein YvdD [Spirochaetes bacterium ADurb.Bin133]HNZ25883.1 TIGR00730 family Rossman fold protein [Spirochaetota bacterium]HOF00210.1 TIGR00730 family Rossman fold protein [Spirochaetota bacterium]HOS33431.1 TIGR00730 family Rossman fold protein [Spirochaetota bacterium]HOS54859.1 TIGR00730 family Rossman fold protein [Spirochaetota bacterium]